MHELSTHALSCLFNSTRPGKGGGENVDQSG